MSDCVAVQRGQTAYSQLLDTAKTLKVREMPKFFFKSDPLGKRSTKKKWK